MSVCHHGLATERVSAPPRGVSREGWGHNQQSTRSHVKPSRGRRVLSVDDNPDAVLTAIEPAVRLDHIFLITIRAADWFVLNRNTPTIGAWRFRRTRGG